MQIRIQDRSRDYHRIIYDVTEVGLTQKVKEQYTVLSNGKDFTIVETAHTLSYGSYGLSDPHIASHLDCPAVVIAEGEPKKLLTRALLPNVALKLKM